MFTDTVKIDAVYSMRMSLKPIFASSRKISSCPE
jgi:hypothetical protein